MFALDLNPDDSLAILGSQNGISQFTIAKHHEFASGIKPPVICIADIKGSQESHGLYLLLSLILLKAEANGVE
jgi:hypothetical protein